MKALEIYTVAEGAPPTNANAERVTYISKQELTNATPERFFHSELGEVLVNLCAARVLTLLEKEKEAAIAQGLAEEILKRLTI